MAGIKKFFDKLLKKDRRDVVIKEIPTEENGAKNKKTSAISGCSGADGAFENTVNNAGELTDSGVIALPEKTDTAEKNAVINGQTAFAGGQEGDGNGRAIIKSGDDKKPAKKTRAEKKAEKKGENLPVKAETLPDEEKAEADKNSKKKNGKNKAEESNDIQGLAALLNEDEGKVRDDCLFSGIKKFTEKLGKVIVRYDISGDELLRLAINSQTLGLKETAVSPAYIPAVARAIKRSKENMTVSALVDFPFGENAFTAKIAGVKESVAAGVDEVSVFMPAMSLYKENKKQLAKDLKKIAKSYRKHAGVAFSAENLSEENILIAARAAEKAGLNHVLFAFGESSEEDIKRKLSAVMKSGTPLTLKVLGNVRTADGAAKLFKMGAELVLTPFADEIGDELLKRFAIKSVKLI